jgi:hypothetical protein
VTYADDVADIAGLGASHIKAVGIASSALYCHGS